MGVAGRRAAARRGGVAGRSRASLRGRRTAAAPVDLRLALDPLPHHGAEARRCGGRSGPPVPPRREPAEQRTPYRRGARGVTPLGRAPPVLGAERFRVLRPPRRRGALVRGDSVLVLATRGLVSALETWKAILLFLVLNAVLAAAFLHPLASALHTTLDKSPWAERLGPRALVERCVERGRERMQEGSREHRIQDEEEQDRLPGFERRDEPAGREDEDRIAPHESPATPRRAKNSKAFCAQNRRRATQRRDAAGASSVRRPLFSGFASRRHWWSGSTSTATSFGPVMR